jgi:hypothetical protein
MNKLAILGIAIAAIMAGAYLVIQPIQQANAVHSTILAGTTQLRSAASVGAAAPTTVTLTCDAQFDVITIAIDNQTDGGAANTRSISTDWDGAGANFDATVVIAAAALGAAGTDTVDDALAIGSGANGRVIVNYVNTVGDTIDTAFGFFTTNSAVCSSTAA